MSVKQSKSYDRLEAAIRSKFQSGAYYDAQQLINTLYSRLISQGDNSAASRLCLDFGLKFADSEQYDLAIEMGMNIVKILEENSLEVTEDRMNVLLAIFSACPAKSCEQKYKFINRALRWSCGDEHPVGHLSFHMAISEALWADGMYGTAQGHMVFCKNGQSLAKMVMEWSQLGYPSERPLFPLRTVLMLLSLEDVRTAQEFLANIEVDFDSEKVPAPLQFAFLLVAACSEKNLRFYETLRAKYQLIVRRDASFEKYLSEIERKCLGKAPPNSSGRLMGMLSRLLGSDTASVDEV